MKTRILIIDDEPDMLGLLRRIITENTAHEVVTESKPAKALARIEETPFDIVITDLKMPEMDGIELLEVIHERWEEIVVIVVTAFATIETAVEAIRKGAFDYLTKPFRKERILLTIEKAMAWRALSRENQELKAALDDRDESMPMVTVSAAISIPPSHQCRGAICPSKRAICRKPMRCFFMRPPPSAQWCGPSAPPGLDHGSQQSRSCQTPSRAGCA